MKTKPKNNDDGEKKHCLGNELREKKKTYTHKTECAYIMLKYKNLIYLKLMTKENVVKVNYYY